MNNPLVTVIVPFYNVKPFIRQCLDSIAGQTLGDIEVICVDDCGADGSRDEVQRFVDDDPRFRLVAHDVNRRQGAGRNTGMRHARGRYVVFVDSDDWIAPETLSEEVRAIEKHNLDSVWCKYSFYRDGTGVETDVAGWNSPGPEGFLDQRRDDFSAYSCSPCNKIYRRDFLLRNNITFPEDLLYEDLEFYFKVCCHTERTFLLDRHFYFYRQRETSSMGVSGAGRGSCADMIRLCRNCHEYMIGQGMFEKRRDFFINLFAVHFENFLYSRHYKEEAIRLLQELFLLVGFPDRYDASRTHVFNAVSSCSYRESLRKWYGPLTFLNRLNPSSGLRRKWRAWIRVNCLAE